MKKILIAILLIVCTISCENNPYIGYIVCKEYIPEHLSNEKPTKYVEASYVPHVIIISHTSPHKINEEYVFYIANKESIKRINVTKESFNYYKIKDKVKVYKDTLYKL